MPRCVHRDPRTPKLHLPEYCRTLYRLITLGPAHAGAINHRPVLIDGLLAGRDAVRSKPPRP